MTLLIIVFMALATASLGLLLTRTIFTKCPQYVGWLLMLGLLAVGAYAGLDLAALWTVHFGP